MSEDEYNGKLHWKNSKQVASKFFQWIHQGRNVAAVEGSAPIDLTSVDRDRVHLLFAAFASLHPYLDATDGSISGREKNRRRRLEALVLAVLKKQKLYKSKRYSDGVVVCSFARSDKTFATFQERRTARDVLMQERKAIAANKGGVIVGNDPITEPNCGPILPVAQDITVLFPITLQAGTSKIKLAKVRLGGSHKNAFKEKTKWPFEIPGNLELSFRARNTGVFRATLVLSFQNTRSKNCFDILRSFLLRAGDADQYDILKPTSPYVKRQRNKVDKPAKEKDILHPPAQAGSGSKYTNLKQFKVPLDVREMVESREMANTLIPPTFDMDDQELAKVYPTFWQNLLWVSELQAYEDIKLFDMENATLQRSGRFFKLYVAGLAEGRPSVLRGDLVNCHWKGKQYRGRVYAVELLDVLMEFHNSFHTSFNVKLDRVDVVRFTFSRTAFRTSHAGCLAAIKSMGPRMLAPQARHVANIASQQQDDGLAPRMLPQKVAWASQSLNDEQKEAVMAIAKGNLRPLPYVIFGPPGTGKTTTLVESVYQLARLHTYHSNQPKLKILLVAPSNDATDILVEKLSPYFPPSEMMRVLAYTRSIDQVPPLVQPYIREKLEPNQLISDIESVQIIVATVNLAARLWCTGRGVQNGHFDVICVDEAGHATEPEVVGVTAKLMKFSGKRTGQMVLAGDPNQLGPIITSDLCKKYGLGVSFMERLVKTSPAYSQNDNGDYPPGLVTLLVRNYRSHPSILKLPNEMFYDSKLIPCGDRMTTHSMTKWEHLPNLAAGFPVIFHAVDGENLREGNSPSWFNPQEAILVVATVGLLVKHSRPAIRQNEIGIITPYARQVQKIRLLLKASDMGDVKVGSVETFQGQERRCIVISTVRSENDLLEHDRKYNLGFVANEKRFNVAVTRAKALLVVIGNPRVLQTDTKNWLPLLRYCRDNGSWMGQEWDEAAADADGDGDYMETLLYEGNEDQEGPGDEDNEWEMVTDQETRGFINREE